MESHSRQRFRFVRLQQLGPSARSTTKGVFTNCPVALPVSARQHTRAKTSAAQEDTDKIGTHGCHIPLALLPAALHRTELAAIDYRSCPDCILMISQRKGKLCKLNFHPSS